MTRVLLVPDVKGWAWWYRACDLRSFAPDGIDCTIRTQHEYRRDINRRGAKWVASFDAVFAMSWAGFALDQLRHAKRKVTLVTSCGSLYRYRAKKSRGDWREWTATVSRNCRRAAQRLPKFDAVVAVNRAIFNHAKQHNPRTYLVPSGVNTSVFAPPTEDARFSGRKLIVGWCASPRGDRSVKGYEEVYKPLRASIGDKRFDWWTNTRDHRNAISRQAMVERYQSTDVLLCTSITEGTPSPIFEAAACGCCIVSTNVGMVTDWALPHNLELVAPAYWNKTTCGETIKSLARILNCLADDRDRLRSAAAALREDVTARYGYETIAPLYFDAILHG